MATGSCTSCVHFFLDDTGIDKYPHVTVQMDLYDDLDGPDGAQNNSFDGTRSDPTTAHMEDTKVLVRQELGHCKQQVGRNSFMLD